ncbi:hypothetical protein SAMN05660493_01850 [Epilithonimonas bovis DSM 19482]|uniref:Outer membrane protein beta-barrel domain-containing protein n=1 Tax=Epilithonimonas bovis DSM 19482 TaxID=1121284 RepID=A0A1U7PZ31_9FLAO|nr:hypothetical protein [Epilithonimonas bovis]SIT97141.1 hypothetical protein SAMN05660493_01850 [Epilithonimonas bovis DSM 19482]HBR10719.1 hypothetical protein [Chryseobacterium sp.]
MLKKILLTLFLGYTLILSAQNRDQYVKWKLSGNYSKIKIGNTTADQYSTGLAVAVAIDENDVYDSASLYLEPFVNYSFFTKSLFTKLSYQTYSAGINLKKHINSYNNKKSFFIFIGPELAFIRWKQILKSGDEYIKIKPDYMINIGLGLFVTNNIELVAQYKFGLSKVYGIESLNDEHNIQTLSIGIRLGFNQNWWFRGK